MWVGLENWCVALGREARQARFDDAMLLVGNQLPEGSIYRLLAEHGGALFGDEYFADLFKRSTRGRPTVPARAVATVMLLQAYEGLSDREACDRLAFDLSWKAAAGLTVARDRVISTVDVEARHGHKSRARTFDGYKSHLGVDPDDELITNVAVTPANTADREVIDTLLDQDSTSTPAGGEAGVGEPAGGTGTGAVQQGGTDAKGFEVYGDSAYADGATLDGQPARGHDMRAKVPPVRNANGYSKDQFDIDLTAGTVTCPAHHTVAIRKDLRYRVARFGVLCSACPLRAQCTTSRRGRVISIHPQEAALQHAKARQKDPSWQQDYRTDRPIVERRISPFTRRPWGGRKARCRGQKRILTDILARASAINLARLATLRLHRGTAGWAIA